DEGTRRRADTRTPNRIADQAEHRLLEFSGCSDLDGGAIAEKRFRNLAEVLHMWTEDDRLSVQGGFEDVVTAGRNKATADEDDSRDLIQLCELPDGVEDEDRKSTRLNSSH